ncbi:TetR/AcrR family transcriptional regulator [Spiractinospora alimapuensis]|uniref:TetR/AcrR family transcriptional regulator n=1 Tax=Spiractinospora alimapuensis TaxID=2820884 RepID=UPI001F319EA2|nr:TetR/AcrR family transcriptional regulator [Spiractinospora alimapuensis]QVQ52720.1 TetR/AcrR family transcriptional regulator [Spiractinospora alimapuensis]
MTDQDARSARERIVDAVFRLVERGGVAEASLRKVATESGINIGSVRHYFGSHEALLVAAAEEVGARMERRLLAGAAGGDTKSMAERRALLEHVAGALLPTGPEDRGELIVLGEFVTAARIHPEFRALAARMGRDMRDVVRDALDRAQVPDLDLETERLVALIDGLTFELVNPHGARESSADPGSVIRHHVSTLLPG